MWSIAHLTSRRVVSLVNQQECKRYKDAGNSTPENKRVTEWCHTHRLSIVNFLSFSPDSHCSKAPFALIPCMLPCRPCDKLWWPMSLLKTGKAPYSTIPQHCILWSRPELCSSSGRSTVVPTSRSIAWVANVVSPGWADYQASFPRAGGMVNRSQCLDGYLCIGMEAPASILQRI
jgi:hypothetical protein